MSLFSLLIDITLFQVILSYYLTGNELRDFETQNLSSEISAWPDASISNCNGTYLIGGYGIFGSGVSTARTYTSLPVHNMIHLSISIWRIDSWDAFDSAKVYIDGRLYQFYSKAYGIATFNLCGGTHKDHGRFDAIIHALHNATNLTLKLQNGCDQGPTDESVGFRDIRILFLNETSPKELVWVTNTKIFPNGTEGPSCETHNYYNSSQLDCLICDDACLNCTESTNRNCTSCNPIGYYNSTSSCLSCSPTCYSCFGGSVYNCSNCSLGNYLYPNNQCLPNCPIAPEIGVINKCNFPCKLGEYLYPNGSCTAANCTLGFFAANVSSSGAVCIFDCGDKYRYDNGTCLDACIFPFYVINIYGMKFCRFICSQNEYYYRNNSCLTTCTYPWIPENISVSNICNFPCSGNLYLYQNISCLPACEFPFTQKNISIGLYCEFPCQQNEFFYINKTCLSSCSYPFTVINTTVGYLCDFPCKRNEFYYQNHTCNTLCEDPFLGQNVSVGGYCNFKCKSDHYLFLDGTCTNNCSSPFLPIMYYNNPYCIFPCPKIQYLHTEDYSCRNLCRAPKIIIKTQIPDFSLCVYKNETNNPFIENLSKYLQTMLVVTMTTTVSMLPFGFDPFTAMTVLIVMQNFFFTLFYNVDYPEIVKILLGTFGVTVFNFIPNPIDWFINPVPDLTSPENFYVNNYTGFFFFTAFQSFVMIAILIASYICGLLAKYFQRPRLFVKFGRVLYRKLDKSFMVRFLLSLYQQLLLSALLQILVIDFSRPATTVAYFFSIFTIVLCFVLPIIAYKVLDAENITFRKLKEYDVFIEDYDINQREIRIFGVYVISKRFLHSSALVLLYYIPILQCIIPSILNLVMIILMLRLKPHHREGLNTMDFVNEIGMLGLHCTVLVLAYFDTLKIGDWNQREMCGYIILGSISIVFIASIIFVWKENFVILKKIFLFLFRRKKEKSRSKTYKQKKKKFYRKNETKNFDRLIDRST